VAGYFAIRQLRSPAFFKDSIFCPPLVPRMPTNPRTSVLPPARCGYDFVQRRAHCAPHHRGYFGLILVAALARATFGVPI
jgi:hypothetical protein